MKEMLEVTMKKMAKRLMEAEDAGLALFAYLKKRKRKGRGKEREIVDKVTYEKNGTVKTREYEEEGMER